MNRIIFGSILMLLMLTGCRRDGDVKSVLSEARSFTDAFVHEVVKDSTFSEGVKRGHEYLNEYGPDMRKKWKSLEDYNQVQVRDETLEKLEDFVYYSRQQMAGIRMCYAEKVQKSEEHHSDLDKLIDRYYEVLDH